jgi:hypothetical protein
MRAAILASAIVLGFIPTSLAMPVASPPVLPDAIRIHGCHHHYAHDVNGWHRHDKECRSLRGTAGGKSRTPAKS